MSQPAYSGGGFGRFTELVAMAARRPSLSVIDTAGQYSKDFKEMTYHQPSPAIRGLHIGHRVLFGMIAALNPLKLINSMREVRRTRRDYMHLHEMPDHLLNDIGLSRGDVHAELANCAQERKARSYRDLLI